MTRGKHGQAAQAKADAAAMDRIRALEAGLASEREAHRLTREELQAAKDRGAGDLIAAKREASVAATANMQDLLDTAKASIRQLAATNAEVRKSYGEMFSRACDHFVNEHGWTGADAVQQLAEMLGFKGYIADAMSVRKLSPERAYELDKARGLRTTPRTTTNAENAFNTNARPW